MSSLFIQWMMMAFTALHPFYVSMTEINHNAKEKELEISVRIFTDDFETALRNNYKEKVDLTHPSNQAEMNKLVSVCLQKTHHLFFF